MSAVNSVTLSGRLVRDPELVYAKSGTPILNNAIAVEEYNKNADDGRDVSFINFVVFGNFAEKVLVPKLKKGDNITISGRMRQRRWETPEGDKRSAVEIIANEVVGEFQYRTNGETSAPAEAAPAPEEAPVSQDDEIPF